MGRTSKEEKKGTFMNDGKSSDSKRRGDKTK